MTQVEINGVTVEFDEKLIIKQELRVGDPVQLLKKEYSSFKLYKGVVTQILPFNDTPAIEVMYIEESYSDFSVKFAVVTNGQEDGLKIIRTEDEFLPFTKDRAIDILDSKIRDAKNELRKAQDKKEYFLRYYNKYFADIMKDTKDE